MKDSKLFITILNLSRCLADILFEIYLIDIRHSLTNYSPTVFFFIINYLAGELVGRYYQVNFWETLQELYINNLSNMQFILDNILITLLILLIIYTKPLWVIFIRSKEAPAILLTYYTIFIYLPIYFGVFNLYICLEATLLAIFLALWWQTPSQLIPEEVKETAFIKPKHLSYKERLISGLWTSIVASLLAWTLIGGYCYAPWYLQDIGVISNTPNLRLVIDWAVQFLPSDCKQCNTELVRLDTAFKWQEKYPRVVMQVYNYYFTPTPVPEHYHVWDSNAKPPLGFTGYADKTPKGMINPGGITRADVWGDNKVETPQTATEFGPLENPIYFDHPPEDAHGFKLYTYHCERCLSEALQIFSLPHVIEEGMVFDPSKETWEEFWSAHKHGCLNKASALHFHVWDLKNGVPSDFFGYGKYCPKNLVNPFGSTLDTVWDSTQNVVSRHQYLATMEKPQEIHHSFLLSFFSFLKLKTGVIEFFTAWLIVGCLLCFFAYWNYLAQFIAKVTESFFTKVFLKPTKGTLASLPDTVTQQAVKPL